MRKSSIRLFAIGFVGFVSIICFVLVGLVSMTRTAYVAPPAYDYGPDQLPDMIERISPGIVNISSSTTIVDYQIVGMDDFLRLWGFPQERKQTFLGSGFIIDKDGYISRTTMS